MGGVGGVGAEVGSGAGDEDWVRGDASDDWGGKTRMISDEIEEDGVGGEEEDDGGGVKVGVAEGIEGTMVELGGR